MRLVATVVALILSALSVSAQTPEGTQVIFPVRVNTVLRGEVSLVIGSGGAVWVNPADLRSLGVRVEVDPTAGWSDLRALAPSIEYRLNEEALELELTVDPLLLGTSALQSVTNRPAGVLTGNNPSAFLNYALFGGGTTGSSAALEIGGTRGSHLVHSDLSVSRERSLSRGLTHYRYSDRDRMQEWTIGDRALGQSLLGGRPILGGVSLVRNFGLDPYFVRTPTLGLEGIAQTPSEVEIYVNGILVRRQRVQPGQVRMDDLPLTTGSGDVRMVIRDAFGREFVQDVPYYIGRDTLRKGLWEYQLGAGLLRGDFRESFDYDGAAVYGEARYGFSNQLTLEGRTEAGEDLISGDAGATLRTRLGQLGALVGGSRAGGDFHPAFAGSYRYSTPRYGFALSLTRTAAGYQTLTSRPNASDATDVLLVASLPVPYVALTVSVAEHREEGRDRRTYGASATVPILKSGALHLSAANVTQPGRSSGLEASVGMTWRLGRDTSAALQARSDGESQVLTTAVQKTLPQGPGHGYRVHWSAGDSQSASTAVQYQTEYGRFEVAADPRELDRRPTISASGGLVYIGNRIFATRTTGQSYALVRVAGLEGVRVMRSNQVVGRTGRGGDLLVPDLLPYYANTISVDDTDIPVEYRINSTRVLVAPPSSGGALIEFPILRVQSVTGKLSIVTGEEESVPALGSLRVTTPAGAVLSPIGRDGSFWLEDVPAGVHAASVTHEGGECVFQFSVPRSDELYLDVGKVRCSR